MPKKPDELLNEFSKFFLEKNANECYGNSYKDFGKICEILFPEGINVNSKEMFDKTGVFFMIVHKVLRIAKAIKNPQFNFEKPFDNSRDLSIYSSMLAELFLVDKNE